MSGLWEQLTFFFICHTVIMHAVRKLQLRKEMVGKGKDFIAIDTRFTTRYIVKCVGISTGAAHTILRGDLK
jgi:hypothetical protein